MAALGKIVDTKRVVIRKDDFVLLKCMLEDISALCSTDLTKPEALVVAKNRMAACKNYADQSLGILGKAQNPAVVG